MYTLIEKSLEERTFFSPEGVQQSFPQSWHCHTSPLYLCPAELACFQTSSSSAAVTGGGGDAAAGAAGAEGLPLCSCLALKREGSCSR